MFIKKWFKFKLYSDEIIVTEQRKIIRHEREQKEAAAKMLLAVVKSLDRVRVSDDLISALDLYHDRLQEYRDEETRTTVLYYIDGRKIH